MWFGLTIARSSPASTQWCRKTLLSTARARGDTPNETLETPSDVLTPGSSSLTRRMPSIVSIALGCLRHADLVDRQRDQRRAVGDGERDDPVRLVLAGLEVDRVDDRAARDLLERLLDDLGLGDLEQPVVVVGEQQLLGLAGALRVDALADERRARVLHERGRRDHARHVDGPPRRARLHRAAGAALVDRADV